MTSHFDFDLIHFVSWLLGIAVIRNSSKGRGHNVAANKKKMQRQQQLQLQNHHNPKLKPSHMQINLEIRINNIGTDGKKQTAKQKINKNIYVLPLLSLLYQVSRSQSAGGGLGKSRLGDSCFGRGTIDSTWSTAAATGGWSLVTLVTYFTQKFVSANEASSEVCCWLGVRIQ